MKKIGVLSLPLAANVCNQMLREVYKNEDWSLAHVVMNPGAFSLYHVHYKMAEVYAITRGFGELVIGFNSFEVRAGSVMLIPKNIPHQLINIGATSLEHFVLAVPAFDSKDVEELSNKIQLNPSSRSKLPKVAECFDGAQIIPYEFPELDFSLAFGWAINDPKRHKEPHYHKRTTEFIYVVEGSGVVEVGGELIPVKVNDFVQVDPGLAHAIRNTNDQYLFALCMCSPRFDMEDVHYK